LQAIRSEVGTKHITQDSDLHEAIATGIVKYCDVNGVRGNDGAVTWGTVEKAQLTGWQWRARASRLLTGIVTVSHLKNHEEGCKCSERSSLTDCQGALTV
jgi:hypothetical protein